MTNDQSLPWLPEGPGPLPKYPTIFARTSFASSIPHVDDLDKWRSLIGRAAELVDRARRAPEFIVRAPVYPELPPDAQRALDLVSEGKLADAYKPPDPSKFSLPPPGFLETVLMTLSSKRRERRDHERRRLNQEFRSACEAHIAEVQGVEWLAVQARHFLEERERRVQQWNAAEAAWDRLVIADRERWESLRRGYRAGTPAGVEAYFDELLDAAAYPVWGLAPREMHYDAGSQILLADIHLPDPNMMKVEKTRSLKKGPTRVPATKGEAQAFKEATLYFQVLFPMWEIANADDENQLGLICVNGQLTRPDPATGHRRTDTILSVAAKPEELRSIRLQRVTPAACFRSLKGLAAAQVTDLVPVRPVVQFDREDGRFVDGRAVLSGAGENLAAMDWQDFEHLIRELFEREYASNGAEVRVTRASRDRGVDAVIFDPDPLRGGKYIVQAKRYTRTVDVASVRELYGTVQAEGANKGILVTTTSYGRDAVDFAKDKPLTLLTGANLLSLLARHGYDRFRIDLNEARERLKRDDTT